MESAAERLRTQKEAHDLATSRFWINKWFPPSLAAPSADSPATSPALAVMQPLAPDVDPEQIMLNPAVFRDMRNFLKFKPSADMFASASHHQLPRYYSKSAVDLASAGVDAVSHGL